MPLYEYGCSRCGRKLEVLQRLDEAPLTICPHCQGPLKKLLSAPAFQFKGAGWYVTDYARKGADTAGEKKTEAAPASSTESPSAGADAGADKPAAPAAPAKPAPKPPSDG